MKYQTLLKKLVAKINGYPGDKEEARKFVSWCTGLNLKQKRKKKKKRKPTYTDYLKGAVWREIRKRVFKLKGRFCEACQSTEKIHVHHTTYSKDVMNGDTLRGLFVLCETHHDQVHEREKMKKTGLMSATLEIIREVKFLSGD